MNTDSNRDSNLEIKTTMKICVDSSLQQWGRIALLLVTAAIITACGGSPAAPAEAVPTVAASEEAAENAQSASPLAVPESPLAQPGSPLGQPDSPLTAESSDVPVPATEDEAIALAAETVAPEAGEGFGTLSGVLYSFGIDAIVPGTQFYLTPADEVNGNFVPPSIYFGPRTEEGDVVGFSTLAGQVLVEDIPPGSYYLAVWTVYDWLLAFESPDAASPLLITVEEGDELNLGMLYVNWP
jgi:hypothetical protein